MAATQGHIVLQHHGEEAAFRVARYLRDGRPKRCSELLADNHSEAAKATG